MLVFLLNSSFAWCQQQKTVKEQKLYEYKIAREAHSLLERWVADGSASGLDGTVWDNRDDGHSRVKLEQLPGMTQFPYSKADARTVGWGLQLATRDSTTVGNSSTAHKQIDKGSQPRCAYSAANGLKSLRSQYKHNNVYIYPSHMDHIGGNTREGKSQTKKWGQGRGDMYPTNTPYVIITQGSSGTDQPFIRAVSWAIGSFSPEVRKKLENENLLMPTVQSLLRLNQFNIKSRGDYLSGKAHPAVFDRINLDAIGMMEAAHDMRIHTIPPLVQLTVVSEDEMKPGRDFLGPIRLSEKHFDSPEVISRIWRGYPMTRTMEISAEKTIGFSDEPLRYHWIVLRGPREKVTITPLTEDRSTVRIEITYPGRTKSQWIDQMWSNRLDIGVFAETSHSISAPAFITWMTLDNEQRTYDPSGKLTSIDYGTGRYVDPRLTVGMPFRDEFEYSDGRVSKIQRIHATGVEENKKVTTKTPSSPGENVHDNALDKKNLAGNHAKTAARPVEPIPSLPEIRDAENRLAELLTQNSDELIAATHTMRGADLYVALSKLLEREIQAGDIAATALAYNRMTQVFSGNFTPTASRALALFSDHSQAGITNENIHALCGVAIHAHQNAINQNNIDHAKQFAQMAISLSRLCDDVSLKRRVVREVLVDN